MKKILSCLLPYPFVSAAFLTAFTFFLVHGPAPLDDPDLPWHIAAGSWILANGSIPVHDPFSFTAGTTHWYNISWLWDIALSFIHSHFGLAGVNILGIAVVSFTLAFLYHVLRKRDIADDAALVTLFLTSLVLWSFSLSRPQVITYLMAVLFCYILHKSRNGNFRGLLLLPPLMALWVNTHGAFLAGFIFIGAYGVEAYITHQKKWLTYLIITGIVTFLAIFINPYGAVGIIIATLRTLDSVITDYITEWHPFSYGGVWPCSFYLLVVLLVSNPRNKDIPFADKLLAFAWMFMALNSIRNFAVLALAAAPYMAANIQQAMRLPVQADISGLRYRARMAAFTLASVLVLMIPPVQHFLIKNPNASSFVPTEEMAYVKTHYNDKRFFNDYDLGGYLIYFMPPPFKVFVDGRAGTAYTDKFLKEVIQGFETPSSFGAILDKYGVEGVIVRNTHPLARYYETTPPAEWQKVFKGKVATVYIRKKKV